MKRNKIVAFIFVAIIMCGLSGCSNKKRLENSNDTNQVHNVEKDSSKQNNKNKSSNKQLDNDNTKKDIQIDNDNKETKKSVQNNTQNNTDITNYKNTKSIGDVNKTKLEINDIKYDPVFSFLQVKVNNVKLFESLSIYLDGKQFKYDLKKDMKIKEEKNSIIIKNVNGQFKKGKVVITDVKKQETSKMF